MTERMFQERQVPWWMDTENGAEIENYCPDCGSKSCNGECTEVMEETNDGGSN